MITTQLPLFISSRLREPPLFIQSMQNIEDTSSQLNQGIQYLRSIYLTFLITFLMIFLPLFIYPIGPNQPNRLSYHFL